MKFLVAVPLLMSGACAFVGSPLAPATRPIMTSKPQRKETELQLAEFSEVVQTVNANLNGDHSLWLADAAKTVTKTIDKGLLGNGNLSWKAAGGASLIMSSIIGLLFLWDRALELFRRQVPITIKPVVDSIFTELAGLAVVGTFLGGLLEIPQVQESLKSVSKDFFGKPDIAIQNFDFFQNTFLELAVCFFVAIAAFVLKGLSKLDDIDEIQDAIVDQQTGYRVTADKLVDYYTIREFNRPQEQPGYTGISREIFMPRSEWSAKILLLRNLVMDLVPTLPPDFRVEALIEESFAQNMVKAVQVPILAWFFLIPPLAFVNAIDISQGVLNSEARNAAISAGSFIEAFAAFFPAISLTIIASIWSYWNCWKMTQIKYMLLPKLEPDPQNGGIPVIRAPPLYNDYLRSTFDSSPPALQRIEKNWGKAPITAFDELFGQAGSAGLELYGNSIKYQAWLSLTNIILIGSQVLPRDLDVLFFNAKSAEPSLVSVEFFVYGWFFLISLFELTWVAPRTFWNYSIVSAMDEYNLQDLLARAGYGVNNVAQLPRSSQPVRQFQNQGQALPPARQVGQPRGRPGDPYMGGPQGGPPPRRDVYLEPDNGGENSYRF